MSDREKVKWLRALLVIWGSFFVPLAMLAIFVTPSFQENAKAVIGGMLAGVGTLTLGYLLVLSWRAAYLSGRTSGRR